MTRDYREYRRHIEQCFRDENAIAGSEATVLSPSSNYVLETRRYSTGANRWDYSRGIVRRTSDNAVVADIKRNYSRFWHAWVRHGNGNEYLLCGEDYQGYSVVNLTRGTVSTFFPDEGHDGNGFCWSSVHPSPDGLVLAVEGCYWGAPHEMVFLEFSHPENLPLPEIARVGDIRDPIVGWVDDTFVFHVEYMVRKSDQVRYEDLSEEEQRVLDADVQLIGECSERFCWRRPGK